LNGRKPVIIAREVSVCLTLVYEAEFDYPKLCLNAEFDDWKPVITAPAVYEGF
jgi:hypothetical protein